MGLPPSAGTDHETVAWPSPAVATTPVGADGADGCDPGLGPEPPAPDPPPPDPPPEPGTEPAPPVPFDPGELVRLAAAPPPEGLPPGDPPALPGRRGYPPAAPRSPAPSPPPGHGPPL